MRNPCSSSIAALAASLALVLSTAVLPALAAGKHVTPAAKPVAKAVEKKTEEDVVVSVPPPSGQWEAKPPAANGWVWSAGYYQWKDGRFVWKAGEWILDKPGMDYRQHEWVQKDAGHWVLSGGNWVPESHASNTK